MRLFVCAIALAVASGAFAQTGLRLPGGGANPPAAGATAPPQAASEDQAERDDTIGRIFKCIAAGLPQDWWRAWLEFADLGQPAWNERSIEGRFFYLTDAQRTGPRELRTCDAREVGELAVSLNKFLDPDKRRWRTARLEFDREGNFELKYEYDK